MFVAPGADHRNHISRNHGDIEALCGAALLPTYGLLNADWEHCERCISHAADQAS